MHLHTRLSCDAPQFEENTVSSYARLAAEKGLKYIAVTEHRDIRTGADGLINADLFECEKQVNAEKRRILEAGRSPLTVLFGVELAHMHTCSDEAAKIIASHKFDFVLGSLHVLKDGFDFYRSDYGDFSDSELKELMRTYLGELYETACTGDFDSFAHCSYPLRYFYRCGRLTELCEMPEKYLYDEYAEIFSKLIERGKALEVNSSGIRHGEFLIPSPGLLALYRSLGGRYVTVGSDSHDFNTVGSGIAEAEKMIAEAGFDGVTVFVGRQPRIIV